MAFLFDKENKFKKILITGGAGFIGGALVRKLLNETSSKIFNIDKLSYSSDLSFLNEIPQEHKERHHLIKLDLCDSFSTDKAISDANPDLIFHLAAESHVDRSIDSPEDFIKTNIFGTYNLLQAVLNHYKNLNHQRKKFFKLIHISTDEVFGSLGKEKHFDETTPYDPNSPYSASKAGSDHLAKAWGNTYGLPIVVTNCSNNFGPWQFPEKLIPLTIFNCLNNKNIPIYGNGENIRDWIYVEDHINALLLASEKGVNGRNYCIGGNSEKSNLELVENICEILDKLVPRNTSYKNLIEFVEDRPGHDFRYSINSSRIKSELGWEINHSFKDSLEFTINWYIHNQTWCKEILLKSGYRGDRIGLI